MSWVDGAGGDDGRSDKAAGQAPVMFMKAGSGGWRGGLEDGCTTWQEVDFAQKKRRERSFKFVHMLCAHADVPSPSTLLIAHYLPGPS